MSQDIPKDWKSFCRAGNYGVGNQEASIRKSLSAEGKVRGYYSDCELDPTLPSNDSMSPSHDHLTHPKDDKRMVVDTRVINDMKTILSEDEFWTVIEHLYAVGIEKGGIPKRNPQKLEKGWHPVRNY